MTVSSTTNRVQYTQSAPGTNQSFAFTFKIYDATDLRVYQSGNLKILNTHYTISGSFPLSSGNVVFITPPATGEVILIERELPLTQLTDYVEGDPFAAETHEDAFDRLVMIAQQLDRAIDDLVAGTMAPYLLVANIDDTPVNGEVAQPISSNWAYDHVAAADPHTGYRLESSDHTHQSTGAQAGQLDHGLALTGLTDDDHTQYARGAWYFCERYASINAAVAAIASTVATLVVSTAQTLTASLTIPSTLSLIILKGGSIIKASNYTLTINGPFQAGPYAVFSGFSAGNITFGSGSITELLSVWDGNSGSMSWNRDYAPRAKCVEMIKVGSNTWKVYKPDGTEIDISASTTSGLQEAIDYAIDYGYTLMVYGGGSSAGGNSFISCSTSVTVPPTTGQCIKLFGASPVFTMTDATPGFIFDSADMFNFEVSGGQIIYVGTGTAVLFKPTNANQETFIGITSSKYIFGDVPVVDHITFAPKGHEGIGVTYDATNGLIINTSFKYGMLNGGNKGMLVKTPGAGKGFLRNDITTICVGAQGTVEVPGVGIQEGEAGTSLIHSNIWHCHMAVAHGTDFLTYAQKGIATLDIGDGTTGIDLESSADGYNFIISQNNAATPVVDNSTSKENYGMYGLPRMVDRGDPAAFDWTVSALTTDGTWRDLNCDAIVPVGARFIIFNVVVQDDAAGSVFRMRKNGNSNTINNSSVGTQVVNIPMYSNFKIPCDANLKIEYYADNTTWTGIWLSVRGWEF
jgi:hypothetical protein